MPKMADRMLYMEDTAKIIRGLFNAMGDPETISFGAVHLPAKDCL